MSRLQQLVSKVLVLEHDPVSLDKIKAFCDANGLIGLKVQADNAMSVLMSNVDLGGILLSEHFGGAALDAVAVGRKINQVRPELPIFLRREQSSSLNDMTERDRRLFRAAYTLLDMAPLRQALTDALFGMAIPQALLRGVAEITCAALESQFIGMNAETENPYIVRDQLIYGQIFTLIPLESNWCRGYMMLQTEERQLMELVKKDRTHVHAKSGDDFRQLNGILGEVTNLIWGAFKNRFMTMEGTGAAQSQVPLIVNHLHRYISFGSSNPQLCFRYTMTEVGKTDVTPLDIYQKFVFNLSWSPEKFSENQASVDDLIGTGELELF